MITNYKNFIKIDKIKTAMREKISISIDKEIIKKVEDLIGIENIRNKSQAFEYALKKFFSSVNTAILLLGKESSIRKENILKTLEKVRSAGIKEVVIAAGPHLQYIFGILKEVSIGLRISYIEENILFGTAGAVKASQKYINSPFLVLAGNIEFEIDILKMIEFHNQKDRVATMCVTVVKLSDSTDNIILNGDKIESFSYKAKAKSRFNNAGIYIFQPKIFESLPDKGSLEMDVFPKLASQGDLFAYISSSEWKQIR